MALHPRTNLPSTDMHRRLSIDNAAIPSKTHTFHTSPGKTELGPRMSGCMSTGGRGGVNDLLPCHAVGAYVDPTFAQQLAAVCGTSPPAAALPPAQGDLGLIEEESDDDRDGGGDDDDGSSSGISTLRRLPSVRDLTPSRRSSVSSDASRKRRLISKRPNARPSLRFSGADTGWMDLPTLSLGGQETFHFPPPSRAYPEMARDSPSVDAYFRRKVTPTSTPFKGLRTLPLMSPTPIDDVEGRGSLSQPSPALPLLSPGKEEEEAFDFGNSNRRRKIVVMGCTGLQGGSVLKYLVEDGSFDLVGTTRRPESARAREWQSWGVEIRYADATDFESLLDAFADTWGLFAVTDWAEEYDGRNTIQCMAADIAKGKNIADAAKKRNIKFMIYSSAECLPGASGIRQSKQQVSDYMRTLKIPFATLIFSFYYQDLVNRCLLEEVDDIYAQIDPHAAPRYMLKVPFPTDQPLPCYDVRDTGGWILPAFRRPEKFAGKDIIAIGDCVSPRRMATILLEECNARVIFRMSTKEDFRYRRKTFQDTDFVIWEWMRQVVETDDKEHWDRLDRSIAAYPAALEFRHFCRTDPDLRKLLRANTRPTTLGRQRSDNRGT